MPCNLDEGREAYIEAITGKGKVRHSLDAGLYAAMKVAYQQGWEDREKELQEKELLYTPGSAYLSGFGTGATWMETYTPGGPFYSRFSRDYGKSKKHHDEWMQGFRDGEKVLGEATLGRNRKFYKAISS